MSETIQYSFNQPPVYASEGSSSQTSSSIWCTAKSWGGSSHGSLFSTAIPGVGGIVLSSTGSHSRKFESKCKTTTPTLHGVEEVHGWLGMGSFGQVYRCSLEGMQGEVAVKVLNDSMSIMGCAEVELLQVVNHPCLVRLIKVIEGPPEALVFELCAGGTLQALLHKTCASVLALVGIGQRVKAAYDIVSAVDYLHSMDVVHRDVKSGNSFLSEELQHTDANVKVPLVKLGDLGLARLVRGYDNPREMTRNVGTVRYMAPEVMTESDYKQPADVFSCAILLHELISGMVPYGTKRNEARLCLAILNGDRPLLDIDVFAGGGIMERLRNLISDSWNADPDARPTASQLMARLRKTVEETTAALDLAD